MLAPHLREGATIVLESTTYPDTTEELVALLLEEGSGLAAGVGFHSATPRPTWVGFAGGAG
ncbi:MAG: hypothetical protein ACR2G7_10735 [Acidimicrobiales bacterium]